MSTSDKKARQAAAARERTKRKREKQIQAGAATLEVLRSGEAGSETLESARASIKAGDCPLCGASGYKVVALHCEAIHGVSTRDLRDLVGFIYTESICDPAHSEAVRARSAGVNPRERGNPNVPRSISKAGKANIAARARAWGKGQPSEVKAAAGRKGGSANKGQRRSEVKHGTRGEYRKGCRCALCVEANKKHWQEWRSRKKQEQGRAAA